MFFQHLREKMVKRQFFNCPIFLCTIFEFPSKKTFLSNQKFTGYFSLLLHCNDKSIKCNFKAMILSGVESNVQFLGAFEGNLRTIFVHFNFMDEMGFKIEIKSISLQVHSSHRTEHKRAAICI